MQAAWLDYLVIAAYFAVVIGVGVHFSRDRKTAENYLLGGRNMPYFTIGVACIMSILSSISIVMVPGEIVNHGLTLTFFGLVGTILGIPCYLLFMRFYFKLGSFTPYEYLERRYDGTVRAVVAVSAFYARVMYLGMVLFTTSKILEASYRWPALFSILFIGAVSIVYTVMGGSKAVIWTDFFQFFVLVGGLVAVIAALCLNIDGGAAAAVAIPFADGHGLPQFGDPDFYGISPYVRLLFWLLLLYNVMSSMQSAASDQLTVQRLLSARNWKEGLKAQIVATVFGFFFSLILWFVGLALYTYFKQNPDPMVGERQGDAAFFRFVALHLPPPLSGLFMAGMFAAIMSTLSAGYNAMAAVWLKEFHQKFINRRLDDEGQVRVSRWATFGVGAFSMILAMGLALSAGWLGQTVAEVGVLFGVLGAVVLPAFLFAALSPRANARLIWCYTFYAFGETIAMNLWYALSRSARRAWEEDPTRAWGWADKLEARYALLPLAAGAVLAAAHFLPAWRRRWPGKLSGLLGMLLLGAAEGMLLWYGFSHYYIDAEPLERSFNFGPPVSLALAFIILFFCPRQPRGKCQGLTLGTLGQPLADMTDGGAWEK